MRRRQITLEDGRYLIFYTFEDEQGASSNSDGEAGASADSERRAEPDTEPQATEERRV